MCKVILHRSENNSLKIEKHYKNKLSIVNKVNHERKTFLLIRVVVNCFGVVFILFQSSFHFWTSLSLGCSILGLHFISSLLLKLKSTSIHVDITWILFQNGLKCGNQYGILRINCVSTTLFSAWQAFIQLDSPISVTFDSSTYTQSDCVCSHVHHSIYYADFKFL